MPTWNDAYEATPRQGYNPGYGAREFQTMKARISDRLDIDHIFGENETLATGVLGESLSGFHKEGSARISVTDGNQGDSTRALSRISNTVQPGRIFLDVSTKEIVDYYEVDEVADSVNREAIRDNIISVVAELVSGTPSVETIFDYDAMVNRTYDQTIGGIKEFTLKARTADVTSTDLEKDDEATALSTLTNDEKKDMVNMGQLRQLLVEAKEHNILTTDDVYNTVDDTVDGIDYTAHNIQVNAVYAKNVYGATWG